MLNFDRKKPKRYVSMDLYEGYAAIIKYSHKENINK